MKSMSITELRNGAIVDILNAEIQRVTDNINDPSTPSDKKRSITLKVDFLPDGDRDMVNISATTKIGLCGNSPVEATVYMDQERGKPFMVPVPDPRDGVPQKDSDEEYAEGNEKISRIG